MLKRIPNDKLKKYRLVALLVAVYFLFSYFALLSVKPVYASEELQHHYETSGVVEDLESFFYNEENKTTTFSTDVEYDTVKLLYFLEYGYGYDDLYSIYIYTYIPLNNYKIDEILFNSNKNTLTFGFTDTSDDILKVDYNKLRIKTKTENKGVNIKSWYQFNKNKTGAFVKWQVELGDYSFLLNDCKERYYCISGIELHEKGKSTATEFLVGSIFKCYKNEDKIDCVDRFDNLPSVNVDVYHTFYRTGVTKDSKLNLNGEGSGWQDQISSCYFSLPKYVGSVDTSSLSSIKAEFDYYYTTPILILPSYSKVYEGFNYWKGKTLLGENEFSFRDTDSNYKNCEDADAFCSLKEINTYPYFISNTSVGKGCIYNWYPGVCNEPVWYNAFWYSYQNVVDSVGYVFDNLGWLFKDPNLDKYIEKTEKGDKINQNYYFSNSNLYTYYERNYKNLSKYSLFDEDGLVYDELLQPFDGYQEVSLNNLGLKYGETNVHTYAINDDIGDITKITFDLLPQNNDDGSSSFWKLLGDSLESWWAEKCGERPHDTKTICPIEKVNYSDLNALTDEQVSNKYFVDINEIDSFRKFCEENKILNKETWLFRYDCCKYYSESATCYLYNSINNSTTKETGFVARESVYLDFDVLEFGFTQKDGNLFKISPTHSPENVFNDLTAQQDVDYSFLTEFLSYIMLLLLAVALVVLVIVCWPVISFVFNGAGLVLKCGLKIVLVPFKIIGKLFKSKNDNDDDS